MLERINFDLRLRLGTLLLDLIDHLQHASHIPLATLNNHQSHLWDERYIYVTDKPRAAAERIRRPDSHTR